MLTQARTEPTRQPRGNYRWTEPQDAMLRLLFAEGASPLDMATQINCSFGTAYSGNAVMVHANVIGLRRPGKRPGLIWTDAMNTQLRAGIADKLTQRQIGVVMGLPLCAISDQARRLGRMGIALPRIIQLPNEPRRTIEEHAAVREMMDKRDAAERRRKRLDKLLNFVPREWREVVPLPEMPDVVTDPLNLTLMEVGRMQCHWITNDDMSAALYCGHPVGHGEWCGKHWGVVKRPTTMMGEQRIEYLAATDARRAEQIGHVMSGDPIIRT